MLFAGGAKGIALDRERLALKVVEGDDPEVLIHDPTNRSIAHMLILMPPEGFPVALGVIYEDPRADLRKRGHRAEQGRRLGQDARPPGARRQGPDLDGREGTASHSSVCRASVIARSRRADAAIQLRRLDSLRYRSQ